MQNYACESVTMTDPSSAAKRLTLGAASLAQTAGLLLRSGKLAKLLGSKMLGAKLLALSASSAALVGTTLAWVGGGLVQLGERLSPPLEPPRPSAQPAPSVEASGRGGGGGGGSNGGRAVAAAAMLAASVTGVAVTAASVWLGRRRRSADRRLTRMRRSSSVTLELDNAQLATEFREAMRAVLAPAAAAPAASPPLRPERQSTRFVAPELTFGRPEDAALGLLHFMCVTRNGLPMAEGTAAIEREIAAFGTDVDRECLEYILRAPAGSSPRRFANSPYPRDCDEGGLRADRKTAAGDAFLLADFVAHPRSRAACLEEAHVVALRLYSTAAYRSLNEPLRDVERFRRRTAHRLPVTVAFLDQAIRQLRANEAPGATATGECRLLYRGLHNRTVPAEFLARGGSELGMMSTTTSRRIALGYCARGCESGAFVLLRLCTSSFMERGADISYLSAFPAEEEVLYPPLTYLAPTGHVERLEAGDGATCLTVVDVMPHFPT